LEGFEMNNKRKKAIINEIKTTHTVERFILNRKTIENFELLENPREIRPSQVGKLHQMLLSGKHFESHLVVNRTPRGKYRVIDGNHRLEAMKKFFKNNPNGSIEIKADVFKNLTIDEEKEKFAEYNLGLKQSPTDWLKVHKNDIPVISMLEDYKDVKITLYPKRDSVSMVTVLKAYIGIWTQAGATQTRTNKTNLIEWLKRLDNKDVRFIKRVLFRIKEITGKEGTSNTWLQGPFLAPTMRIVHDNLDKEDKFWEIYKKSIIVDPDLRVRGAMSSNSTNQELNGKRMLDILNSKKIVSSKNPFVILDNSKSREAFEAINSK